MAHAKKLGVNIKRVRKWMDKYVQTRLRYGRLKTKVPLCIMMGRYGLSLREMVSELYCRSGSRKAASLKRVPSKSWLYE